MPQIMYVVKPSGPVMKPTQPLPQHITPIQHGSPAACKGCFALHAVFLKSFVIMQRHIRLERRRRRRPSTSASALTTSAATPQPPRPPPLLLLLLFQRQRPLQIARPRRGSKIVRRKVLLKLK